MTSPASRAAVMTWDTRATLLSGLQLGRVDSHAQLLDDARLQVVQVIGGDEGLRADDSPRDLIGHPENQMPTALVGKRRAVTHQLCGADLLLSLLEFEALILGGCREPAVQGVKGDHGLCRQETRLYSLSCCTRS